MFESIFKFGKTFENHLRLFCPETKHCRTLQLHHHKSKKTKQKNIYVFEKTKHSNHNDVMSKKIAEVTKSAFNWTTLTGSAFTLKF